MVSHACSRLMGRGASIGCGVRGGTRRVAPRGTGGELRETEIAKEEIAAFLDGVGGREIDQAVLELDVSVDDAHVFVQISYCRCKLVSVATSEVLTETIAIGAHEVEERAAGVEFREAEGCEGRDVYGYEG